MRKLAFSTNVPLKAQVGSTDFVDAVSANEVLVRNYGASYAASKPKLKFPGYTSEPVKRIVRSSANGCCGYCGQRVEGTQTVVVEHFRPKAELHFQASPFSPYKIKEKVRFYEVIVTCDFGYFKFGDDLKNMIPSCSACNSGQGVSGIYVNKCIDNAKHFGFLEKNISYGKDNFFPLYAVRKRSVAWVDSRTNQISVDNINLERPLLFNPYVDRPDDLFSYKKELLSGCTNNTFIQIRPKRNASKYQRLKAEASINLLGLNRKELCHKRSVKNNVLLLLLREVVASCERMDYTPSKWGRFSKKYADQFCLDNSELVGFAMVQYMSLGNVIRSKIIDNVVCTEKSIFTLNDDFFVMIKELSDFSGAIQANSSLRAVEDRGMEELMDCLRI